MKKLILLAAGAALALALGLLPALAAGDMPAADATALWNYISKVSPYKQWGQFPDHKGMLASNSPHGAFTQIWASASALSAKKAPLPAGSIIVKEGMGQDKKVNVLVVMYKVKGFNPEAGDWFWAMYDPDGTAKASGKVAVCISCHSVKAANNYLAAHVIK